MPDPNPTPTPRPKVPRPPGPNDPVAALPPDLLNTGATPAPGSPALPPSHFNIHDLVGPGPAPLQPLRHPSQQPNPVPKDRGSYNRY